jgi:aminomuconate-semialdehyde/2-hydroxymuconate-6-semialdehyde dehydrogenase
VIDLPHIIGGERVTPSEWFESVNPATQQPWARAGRASMDDAGAATAAARRAFDEGPWPRISPDERAAHLHRWADLVDANAEQLAAMETADMGKPITQARTEDIPRSSQNIGFFADYQRFYEDEALPVATGHHVDTRYEPVGVTAAISP